MLLWLLNMGFGGSGVAFFVSGEIPIEALAANISVQKEAQITAQYEATITVQSDDDVSI